MKGFCKNLKGASKKTRRGGGSRNDSKCGKNLYRLGAGKQGRKYVGNHGFKFRWRPCPCHPCVREGFQRRIAARDWAKQTSSWRHELTL